MAGRIRTIKPEVLEDEKAADLSDAAWRLWVSLWVLADDHGRSRAGARYLACHVWLNNAVDDHAATSVEELVRKGFARRYVVEDEVYLELKPVSWKRHQRIAKPGKPRVPVPAAGDYIDGERATVRGRVARIPVAALPGRVDRNDTENGGIRGTDTGGSVDLCSELPDRENTSGNFFNDLTPARTGARVRAGDLRPPTSDHDHRSSAPLATDRASEHPVTSPPSEPPAPLEPDSAPRRKEPRGHRIAEDWTPPADVVAWAAKHLEVRLDANNVAAAAEEFRDFWRAVAGQRGRKLDWTATFRNRLKEIRRQRPWLPEPLPDPPEQPKPDGYTGPPRGRFGGGDVPSLDELADAFDGIGRSRPTGTQENP